jgi:biotin transport system substrate-specific component
VFHTGVAGFGILLGPTGGYLVGFIFAALVVGLAYEHESVTIRIAGLLAGTVIIYIFGVAWLMYSLTLGFIPAVLSGVLPFIPGDVIKIYAAYMIAKRLP